MFRSFRRSAAILSFSRNCHSKPERPYIEDKLYARIKQYETSIPWKSFLETEFPQVVQSCVPTKQTKADFAQILFRAALKHHDIGVLVSFVENHYGIEKLSSAQLSVYLRFCKDSEKILEGWKLLSSKGKGLYDGNSTMNLVHALCKTSKWRHAIALVENLEQIETAGATCYTDIIKKMFEEQLDEEALTWSKRLFKNYPTMGFVDSTFEPALHRRHNIEPLFELWSNERLLIGTEFASNNIWNKYFTAQTVEIDAGGFCTHCKSYLSPVTFTEEELSTMRDMSKALMLEQRNVYEKSTPEEVANFEVFLDTHGPFDVVLDALNVSFVGPKATANENLRRVLDVYSKTKKISRVLLICRAHMMNWPIMRKLSPNVKVYYTKDTSQDDPFSIIACLQSHVDCRIVSRDFFRQHMFSMTREAAKRHHLLDDTAATQERIERAGKLFQRWLITHQDFVLRVKPRVVIAESPRHDYVVQKNEVAWHLPVGVDRRAASYTAKSWLCLKKNPPR